MGIERVTPEHVTTGKTGDLDGAVLSDLCALSARAEPMIEALAALTHMLAMAPTIRGLAHLVATLEDDRQRLTDELAGLRETAEAQRRTTAEIIAECAAQTDAARGRATGEGRRLDDELARAQREHQAALTAQSDSARREHALLLEGLAHERQEAADAARVELAALRAEIEAAVQQRDAIAADLQALRAKFQ